MGRQGVSIAILDRQNTAADIWKDHVAEVVQEPNHDSQLGPSRLSTITFAFQTKNRGTELRMALADATMLDPEDSMLALRRVPGERSAISGCTKASAATGEERLLRHATLRFPSPEPGDAEVWQQIFSSRLRRITSSRKVSAVIGNVVSRLQGNPDGPADIPASKELEAEIEAAIANGDIEPQQAEVWALVRPRNGKNSLADQAFPPVNISAKDLFMGCRLHRVLSGGGGWGHKQGLVSLDPDLSCIPEPGKSPFEVLEQQNENESPGGLFQSVVEPGDEIAFYINNHYDEIRSSKMPPAPVKSDEAQILFHFGTLPSEPDSSCVTNRQEVSRSESQQLLFIPNYFGMLSRQGMSLQVCHLSPAVFTPTNSKQHTSRSPVMVGNVDTQESQAGPKAAGESFINTKLSAPYSAFSFGLKTSLARA